ncbi:hypothetical protein [Flavobacterium sp. 1]|uniref:hypothetical protein n=1 Tax=Flavobacterium sp. 1 TaxID=2035200 RepID=UPI0012FD57AF|nr:hypothetical protein [Flavobacterium sp. 1]
MKIDLILMLKILVLEIIYFFGMFFILLFFFFGYFGSGAGASSAMAIKCGIVADYFLIFPPLLFNLYKIIKLYNNQFAKAMTYLIAEIIMISFFAYQYLYGLIGS